MMVGDIKLPSERKNKCEPSSTSEINKQRTDFNILRKINRIELNVSHYAVFPVFHQF